MIKHLEFFSFVKTTHTHEEEQGKTFNDTETAFANHY
jgi:hypothetical protein